MRDTTVILAAAVTALVASSLWSQSYVSFDPQLSGGGAYDGRRRASLAVNESSSAFQPPQRLGVVGSTLTPPIEDLDRCAICLFGLPRSFEALVLPSLIENVLKPNARHRCDYFVHYYNVTFEASGRSGSGGAIDPEQIRRLGREVDNIASAASREGALRRPVTQFVSDTDDDFWRIRGELVEKIRTTKDGEGRYLYFPWRDKSYRHPSTTDNIIKMWHSIQESWNLMETHATSIGIKYRRVAMLRSDVFYVTPIDVWALPTGQRDANNSLVVTPGFGRCPVSDRLIYGPSEAVKIWASERFERMEEHVQWTLANNPGMGLHSETFVNRALFDPIRELGYSVAAHPTMCFVRARADETMWVKDCELAAPKSVSDSLGTTVQHRVETMLGRNCSLRRNLFVIDCSGGKGQELAQK